VLENPLAVDPRVRLRRLLRDGLDAPGGWRPLDWAEPIRCLG